jgi:hypothetical protein
MFAKGVVMVAPSGGLILTVSGYLAILAILTIFGIWGFRLGSGKSDGNGGGGSKEPEPQPPPSPGGCEVDEGDDFAAWEAQLQPSSDGESPPSDRPTRVGSA